MEIWNAERILSKEWLKQWPNERLVLPFIVLLARHGGKDNYERLEDGRDRHRKDSMKMEMPS